MSTTTTDQTPPQSPQDVPRTSETQKPGFDCRKAAESFLGHKLRGEERVKYLESLFAGASMSGHDLGYKLGVADGRAQGLIAAAIDETKRSDKMDQPAPVMRAVLCQVETQEGIHTRLSFPEIPGLHFVTEYPAATTRGSDNACRLLEMRSGRCINFRPL